MKKKKKKTKCHMEIWIKINLGKRNKRVFETCFGWDAASQVLTGLQIAVS